MIGILGSSNTAYPWVRNNKWEGPRIRLKLLGAADTWPAAEADVNSCGYAHITTGSRVPAAYPGGRYSVPDKGTPSARGYVTRRFWMPVSCGAGSANAVIARSRPSLTSRTKYFGGSVRDSRRVRTWRAASSRTATTAS